MCRTSEPGDRDGQACGKPKTDGGMPRHDPEPETAASERNDRLRSYRIDGMDCGACALTLENHLKASPAVKEVRVHFTTGKMVIEHDNRVEEIVAEVKKVGYTAALIAGSAEDAALRRDPRKTWTVLSGVFLLFGFLGTFGSVSSEFQTFLYAASILTGGFKPARSAYHALRSKSLDMNVLMTVAAIGAVCIGEWLEGATVVWLFALGNMLQNRSMEKTRNSIRSLMNRAPAEAWVRQRDGGLRRKPVERIRIGDTIVVKPGENIPLDGEIIDGRSGVNQAPVTGESVPLEKGPGDIVYAGSISESGALEVRVTKRYDDTALARIIHLVEEAQEKKAPAQTAVDRFASVYTPVVFGAAFLTMLVPPLFQEGTWTEWLYKGLELLVIACPCALVISTPVAIVSAIGNAAKNGVLIKGGASLEQAGHLTAAAFDKTGTLTEGKPKVVQADVRDGSEGELLSIARTIEERSRHPVAAAIVRYATEKRAQARPGTDYRAIAGKGAQATIDGTVYYAGNAKWFRELKLPVDEKEIERRQAEGYTIVLVGSPERLLGTFAVADTIRETTTSVIREIREWGIRHAVMLTGDHSGTARTIAEQAGITDYRAELLPAEKAEAIRQLQQRGDKVAMVGDGINDAPALAAADVGIAMGGAGTDTAMETADIVLMADHLEKLPFTIKLSRKTLRVIKQNIWFSLIVKFAALFLIFPGWLTLWIAVVSDTGAALIVILNGMRLLRLKA
ncbi:heavy metal translocating P-type ATPase [Paenibacillus flagellatus]|uniref:Cd(2+)-exporting ATPase n=1 Tax=Paenibacillus flagellatus TaxID=2211139 RepID=A0A2V5KC11_9BACL|nr:cation-translocating P-type ATPase [Paenibacillus flagellatus]PYI57121.1 cadmium-translocating P-type ATPase [Paenibacillus flagellatus]